MKVVHTFQSLETILLIIQGPSWEKEATLSIYNRNLVTQVIGRLWGQSTETLEGLVNPFIRGTKGAGGAPGAQTEGSSYGSWECRCLEEAGDPGKTGRDLT